MTGICFYFESPDVDVWSGHNLDAWNYAAKAAGDINKVHIVNRTSDILANPDIGTFDFTVSEELPAFENAAVMITPRESGDIGEPLWAFDHNVDWYVFGPASGWRGVYPSGKRVFVPQSGFGDLHSVHIASVVMMHRYSVKSWQ